MNNVCLIGRLTKDIEIKYTPIGKKVTSFSLAVKRNKEQADFINCVAWEHTAEFLEKYTSKGSKIGVNGRLETRTYDTQNGKRYITEVLTSQVELLDSKPQGTSITQDEEFTVELNDDNLPF